MAIKHISYTDLTPKQRRQGAEDARKRITAMMSSPLLTADQHLALQAQMRLVDQWEHGELPTHRASHHEVGLAEAVPLKAQTT